VTSTLDTTRPVKAIMPVAVEVRMSRAASTPTPGARLESRERSTVGARIPSTIPPSR